MEDIEFAGPSGSIIRSIFTSALIYKRRAISARPQFWCLDEIAACGAWPLAPKLATICAGYNIRTAYVTQSTKQLDALAKDGGEIIANSCGTAIYMGTRSNQQASLISGQLGKITLDFDDTARQEAARAARTRAVADMVLNGADPVTAMMSAAHQDRMAHHKTKMARPLRSVDEVINESNDRAYVFLPGVLERPFFARVPRYWHRRDLTGAYLGDPFHAKPGTVEIATWLGQRQRKVITEKAPRRLRDWPQYRGQRAVVLRERVQAMSEKPNNFPREGRHDIVTRDRVARLEATRPKLNVVRHYTIEGEVEAAVHSCVDAEREAAIRTGWERLRRASGHLRQNFKTTRDAACKAYVRQQKAAAMRRAFRTRARPKVPKR